jgi:hypothetical protein
MIQNAIDSRQPIDIFHSFTKTKLKSGGSESIAHRRPTRADAGRLSGIERTSGRSGAPGFAQPPSGGPVRSIGRERTQVQPPSDGQSRVRHPPQLRPGLSASVGPERTGPPVGQLESDAGFGPTCRRLTRSRSQGRIRAE